MDPVPSWDEIKSSPDFQSLDGEAKAKLLGRWTADVRNEASSLPDYNPDQVNAALDEHARNEVHGMIREENKPGVIESMVLNGVRNILPTVGGLVTGAGGVIAGAFTGPAAPVAAPALGLAGGFAGAQKTQDLQDYALKSLMPEQDYAALQDRFAQSEEEHPYASLIGGLVPQAIAFRPSVKNLASAGAVIKGLVTDAPATLAAVKAGEPIAAAGLGNLINVAVNTGVADANDIYTQIKDKGAENFDWKQLAITTLGGMLLNQPTKVGHALSFGDTINARLQANVDAKAQAQNDLVHSAVDDNLSAKEAGLSQPLKTEEVLVNGQRVRTSKTYVDEGGNQVEVKAQTDPGAIKDAVAREQSLSSMDQAPQESQAPEAQPGLQEAKARLDNAPKTLPDNSPLLNETINNSSPERQQFRQEVADSVVNKGAPVPEGEQPEILFMAGGYGAGKGTVLRNIIDRSDFSTQRPVTIDPDAIKKSIPEFKDIVAAGDARAATVVQKESALIGRTAFEKALASRSNIIYDSSMSRFDEGASLIKQARDAGYRVKMIGVTSDVASAMNRAADRAPQELRYVPSQALETAHAGFNGNAERYAPLVDEWQLWDNSGKEGTAKQIASKGQNNNIEIIDNQAYSKFRSRNNNGIQLKQTSEDVRSPGNNQADEHGGYSVHQPTQGTDNETLPSEARNGEGRRSSAQPTVAEKSPTDNPETSSEVENPGSMGPGAASAAEQLAHPGQIEYLKDVIKSVYDKPGTASDKLETAYRAVDAIRKSVTNAVPTKQGVVDGVRSALDSGNVAGEIFKRALTQPEKFTDYLKTVGEWSRSANISDFRTREFQRNIKRLVPDQVEREALTNWIQAGGDKETLLQRASVSKKPYASAYERAANLRPELQEVAKAVSDHLAAKLQQAQEAGIVKDGIENYITQIWDKPNPSTLKLFSEASSGKLNTNFKFALKRVFESYFEGEQAGYKPKTKDVADLIAVYNQAFDRTLASRAMVKSLTEGKASDGRPLMMVSGRAILDKGLPSGPAEVNKGAPNQAVLIKGDAIPKSYDESGNLVHSNFDYKDLTHKALHGWKWVAEIDGKPVLFEGSLLVHPEIAQHLKNNLSTSIFRTNPLLKAALVANQEIKQFALSLPFFHYAQIGEHALFHKINPLDRVKLGNLDTPLHWDALAHGLQLVQYEARSEFADGMSHGALVHRLPVLGPILQGLHQNLFETFIPELKLTMYKEALARNVERYQKDINGGKATLADIKYMTAKEANAAFGGLNYKLLGRSQSFQDFLRTISIAPDFTEARGRFVAQAFNKYGGEQRAALILAASSMYTMARILNKLVDDDYHFDVPFGVVHKGISYTPRTIVGDVYEFVKNPGPYLLNRGSYVSARAREFFEAKDWRGKTVDYVDQLRDAVTAIVPRNIVPRQDMSTIQQVVELFGTKTKDYSRLTPVYDMANKFREEQGINRAFIGAESPYKSLLHNLRINDIEAAQQSLTELLQQKSIKDIRTHFQQAVTKPFTGSPKLELQFFQSLGPSDQEDYRKAVQEQKDILERFNSIAQGARNSGMAPSRKQTIMENKRSRYELQRELNSR